jgi:hypothetical protein
LRFDANDALAGPSPRQRGGPLRLVHRGTPWRPQRQPRLVGLQRSAAQQRSLLPRRADLCALPDPYRPPFAGDVGKQVLDYFAYLLDTIAPPAQVAGVFLETIMCDAATSCRRPDSSRALANCAVATDSARMRRGQSRFGSDGISTFFRGRRRGAGHRLLRQGDRRRTSSLRRGRTGRDPEPQAWAHDNDLVG